MLVALSAPLNSATSISEYTQSILHSGGRLLLMIAMALFLAYVLFMLCAVSISSAFTTWMSLRQHTRSGAVAALTGGSHTRHTGRRGRGAHVITGPGQHPGQR